MNLSFQCLIRRQSSYERNGKCGKSLYVNVAVDAAIDCRQVPEVIKSKKGA